MNPVLFSPEEFTKKVEQGHHFLKTVLGRDKLFLVGSQDDLATTT